MYETLRLTVNFVARYFLLVLVAGASFGVLYGFVTSLIDGNFFVEVLIIDGIVGFVFALFLGLFALYLRPQLPVRSTNEPPEKKTLQERIMPKFLIADRSGSATPLAHLSVRRNACLFGAGLVAFTTFIQCIGSPNPMIALIGGVVLVGPLLVIAGYTMMQMDRLK